MIGRVDFGRNPVTQRQLRSNLETYLDNNGLVPWEQQGAVTDQIVQMARANHTLLLERER